MAREAEGAEELRRCRMACLPEGTEEAEGAQWAE